MAYNEGSANANGDLKQEIGRLVLYSSGLGQQDSFLGDSLFDDDFQLPNVATAAQQSSNMGMFRARSPQAGVTDDVDMFDGHMQRPRSESLGLGQQSPMLQALQAGPGRRARADSFAWQTSAGVQQPQLPQDTAAASPSGFISTAGDLLASGVQILRASLAWGATTPADVPPLPVHHQAHAYAQMQANTPVGSVSYQQSPYQYSGQSSSRGPLSYGHGQGQGQGQGHGLTTAALGAFMSAGTRQQATSGHAQGYVGHGGGGEEGVGVGEGEEEIDYDEFDTGLDGPPSSSTSTAAAAGQSAAHGAHVARMESVGDGTGSSSTGIADAVAAGAGSGGRGTTGKRTGGKGGMGGQAASGAAKAGAAASKAAATAGRKRSLKDRAAEGEALHDDSSVAEPCLGTPSSSLSLSSGPVAGGGKAARMASGSHSKQHAVSLANGEQPQGRRSAGASAVVGSGLLLTGSASVGGSAHGASHTAPTPAIARPGLEALLLKKGDPTKAGSSSNPTTQVPAAVVAPVAAEPPVPAAAATTSQSKHTTTAAKAQSKAAQSSSAVQAKQLAVPAAPVPVAVQAAAGFGLAPQAVQQPMVATLREQLFLAQMQQQAKQLDGLIAENAALREHLRRMDQHHASEHVDTARHAMAEANGLASSAGAGACASGTTPAMGTPGHSSGAKAETGASKTSSAMAAIARAQEPDRQVQLGRLLSMVQDRAPDSDVSRAIAEYKDVWGDFGKERWNALRWHLRSLKGLLLPNQITRLCMWSIEHSDDFERLLAPSAAGAGAEAEIASHAAIWKKICEVCEISPEQSTRLLSLKDSIQRARRDFAETLMLLRGLEEKVTHNFTSLEMHMTALLSIMTPRQAALFLQWNEGSEKLFHVLPSLSAWPIELNAQGQYVFGPAAGVGQGSSTSVGDAGSSAASHAAVVASSGGGLAALLPAVLQAALGGITRPTPAVAGLTSSMLPVPVGMLPMQVAVPGGASLAPIASGGLQSAGSSEAGDDDSAGSPEEPTDPTEVFRVC